MFDKAAVLALLADEGLWHEVTEHAAVYTMGELDGVALPYPEADAKNLFVRDDKRQNYYLITVRGNKRVDLKAFRRQHSTRPLTFVSPEELQDLLGLTPGSVTPFGLLNDAQHRVQLWLDEGFFTDRGLIGVHPNDNTATVWLHAEDLVSLLTAHGCTVHRTAL